MPKAIKKLEAEIPVALVATCLNQITSSLTIVLECRIFTNRNNIPIQFGAFFTLHKYSTSFQACRVSLWWFFRILFGHNILN